MLFFLLAGFRSNMPVYEKRPPAIEGGSISLSSELVLLYQIFSGWRLLGKEPMPLEERPEGLS